MTFKVEVVGKWLLLSASILAATPALARDYDNYSLPVKPRAIFSEGLPYSSSRVQVRKQNIRLKEPSVNAQQYIFAREAFLAEKRDQAIKLLRQEMEAGMTRNRDNMLLRLGQLYAEKYMELSYLESELYTTLLQEYEKKKGTKPAPIPPKLDNTRSRQYLKDALAIFYKLEREYPKHSKMDEVLFFIGFVEMESGNTKKGVRYLERVIRGYARSRKFDEAVIYLADHYFDTQKFRDALLKYRILTVRKNSPIYHYALYKIAWCQLNTGEERKALNDMKSLIQDLANTQDRSKFNLREQAIRDVVVFFGENEAVDEAIEFLTEVQGKEKAIDSLKLIGDVLRSKAKDYGAIKAYTRLLEERPDTLDAPAIQLGIYESLARLGRTDQAVEALVKATERYGETSGWLARVPKEKQAEAKATQENLQAEAKRVAFFYHSAAQKSSNKALYQEAQRLYGALMKYFPSHPDRKKIAFFRAEILYSQQRWLEAANSYMEASKIPPKDKMADEAVYNALLALDQLTAKNEKLERFDRNNTKDVDLTPKPIPEGERRFIEIAELYLKEYPTGGRVVDVRFRIAATYYRYHHYDRAQKEFEEIARNFPKHRSAVTSASLALDIYNIKKDYDGLDRVAAEFAKNPSLGDAKFRAEVAQISAQIGFKKIEKLETQNKWTDAGDAYLRVYKENPNGTLAEKSLYNAYVSFEKGNDLARAVETSKAFVAKYPKSEYTQRLILTQAKLAERQYDFDSAQKIYRDYARRFPKDKEARKALYNAAVFAELLEQNDQAQTLYQEYLRGPVSEEERKSIQISQAKIYRKQGKLDRMNGIYRRLIREAKSVDGKLALLGELSRQYEREGRMAERGTILLEIRNMYSSSGKSAKALGSSVQYVAEAEFKSTSSARERFDKIELRFPPEDLVYLLRRKQKALTRLAESYDKVVDIGVPEWGVAALYEKADAYASLVRGYRNVQIPGKFKGPDREEAEKSLKQIDGQLIKPIEDKANEFFAVCAAKASEFHVATDYASRCRNRMKKGGDEVEPAGLIPMPAYLSTRPAVGGVAKR